MAETHTFGPLGRSERWPGSSAQRYASAKWNPPPVVSMERRPCPPRPDARVNRLGIPGMSIKYAWSYLWVHWPDSARNQDFGGADFMISAA